MSEPAIVIEPGSDTLRVQAADLWRHRDLLPRLLARDFRLRYKQTLIGPVWVLVKPLTTMLLFWFVFGRVAHMSSEEVPYPLFAYAALLPWTYFSDAVQYIAASLPANAPLIRKVYFPRLFMPLVGLLTPAPDFLVSLAAFVALAWGFGVRPGWRMMTLPLFLLLAQLASLSVGVWLAALNVRYRDVGAVLPLLLQAWLYASPVAYSPTSVPAEWRALHLLNPIAGAIDGFRWALLDRAAPTPSVTAGNAAVTLALLVPGLWYFQRRQDSFADRI
jgi:lipopolysaccharide transport system permease protein